MRTRVHSTVIAVAAVLGAPAALAQAPVEMVMTNELATTHWKTGYMEEVAADIEGRCEGRIDVKLYHAGQLYKDREAIAAIGTGAVHMAWPVSVLLDSVDPRYGIIDQPFVLSDELMLQPEARRELNELMSGLLKDRGIEVMGLMRAAELIFLFPEMEVTSAEDLERRKIRVTGGKVLQDVMRNLGVSPVTMPASEMATSLALGAIDGIFTSAGGWEMVGDTAQAASLVPGLSLLTYSVIVDEAWLDGLDEELQGCIRGAVGDMLDVQWERAIEDDRKTLESMLEKGHTFATVPDDEVAAFKEAATTASAEFYERHPDVTATYQAILKKYEE
ncbi:TRAP transporter substrate-binding protein DctP [Acuticoccus sp.]|uniref:TRAP transporter substrate-binding protein DctP n=1 Tax=Acuticoccus sp. TaxID=1904378 RepID=UPI003B528277